MNTKVKTILQQLLQSPRRFPVELALGVVFFIIAVWDSETHVWNEKTAEYVSAVNGDILWFFVPLMALTFWLHPLWRETIFRLLCSSGVRYVINSLGNRK